MVCRSGRSLPVEPILEALDAQSHRRFVKSHLAADGVPFWDEVCYIVVGRDTRDVFMSLWNHYSGHTRPSSTSSTTTAARESPSRDHPTIHGSCGSNGPPGDGSPGSPMAGPTGHTTITSPRGGSCGGGPTWAGGGRDVPVDEGRGPAAGCRGGGRGMVHLARR
ncbi:MAG: hypothetical protein GEU74_08870 [Nitriliruptorales bacterium]|nr:hypothetical protein [Nitriliruptorales bacterium]